MRPLPPEALALIMRFEGFSSVPYVCPAGYWTIGYGALRGPDGRRVTAETSPIDQQTAIALLDRDCDGAEASVQRLTKVPLNDGQYGALVSFTFNLGGGAYQASTLRRKLNEGNYDGAAAEFPRWVLAAGRRLSGLVARRAAERRLFEGH